MWAHFMRFIMIAWSVFAQLFLTTLTSWASDRFFWVSLWPLWLSLDLEVLCLPQSVQQPLNWEGWADGQTVLQSFNRVFFDQDRYKICFSFKWMCFLSLFIHEIKVDKISICYQLCSQCSSFLPTYLSSSVTGVEGVKVSLSDKTIFFTPFQMKSLQIQWTETSSLLLLYRFIQNPAESLIIFNDCIFEKATNWV